jgi:hypothetical protein
MLAATDTATAPWYIVLSDDKKRARLNCIADILSHVPYEEVPYTPPKLPGRQKSRGYIEPQQKHHLLNSRYLLDSSLSIKAHFGNKYLLLGIGAVVILQLLFTYAKPLQRPFDTQAIPLGVWLWLFLGGLLFFLVVELENFIIRSSGSLRWAVTAVESGFCDLVGHRLGK